MALVEQKLNSIAADLKEVAKILVSSKPNLMPVLQKMVEAGKMLMSEVQSSKPQAQQGMAGQPRGGPEGLQPSGPVGQLGMGGPPMG